jgi:hypothetical protein
MLPPPRLPFTAISTDKVNLNSQEILLFQAYYLYHLNCFTCTCLVLGLGMRKDELKDISTSDPFQGRMFIMYNMYNPKA